MFRSSSSQSNFAGSSASGASDASNAAPASTTGSLPSQTFGVRAGTTQAASAASVTESVIILPDHQNVHFSVLHFPESASSSKQIDFGKVRETAELLIRREKPAGEAKRGAGQLGTQPIGVQQGLNLPQAQENFVRKSGRIRTGRQVDPNEQPWLMDVKVNAGAKRQQYRGTKQASITENAAYFLFLMGSPNEEGRPVFLAHPISEWYTFLPLAQYEHLDEDEAENLYQKRNRIQNLFGIMASKRLERTRDSDRDPRGDEPASSSAQGRDEYAFLLEDDAEKKTPSGAARGSKRTPASRDLQLLETADFSSSDDEEAEPDEETKDDKKVKGAAVKTDSKAAVAKKVAPPKRKNAAGNGSSVVRKWKREAERLADRRAKRSERARSRRKRVGLADEDHGDMEEGAYDEALEYDEETSDLDYDDLDEPSDASDSEQRRADQPDEEDPSTRKKQVDQDADQELERVTLERGVQDDEAIRDLNESESESDEEQRNDDDKDDAGPRRRRRGESLSESSSESSQTDRADSSSSVPSDAELEELDASADNSNSNPRKRHVDESEPDAANGKRGRFDADSQDAAVPFGLTAALLASVMGPTQSNTSPGKGKPNWDHKLEAEIRRAFWSSRIALKELLKRLRATCRKMALTDQQLVEKICNILRRLNVHESREAETIFLDMPTNG